MTARIADALFDEGSHALVGFVRQSHPGLLPVVRLKCVERFAPRANQRVMEQIVEEILEVIAELLAALAAALEDALTKLLEDLSRLVKHALFQHGCSDPV